MTLDDALRAAGLEPSRALDLDDGRLVRFHVVGDKAGSRNGWIVYHAAPIPCAAFGSWKTGERGSWRERPASAATLAERQQTQLQMRAAAALRDAEQAKVQAAARHRAERLLALSRPASNDHPYLAAKGVRSYGLRQLREALLVPARDAAGQLHTLQFIKPDGTKRFLTGGRIRGCYFAIGRPSGALVLCEGFATAATIFEATGTATAVCFSCGNLHPVALALREKFPDARLILAADNDAGTPGNPGVRAAEEAARAVGGAVAIPNFGAVRHDEAE